MRALLANSLWLASCLAERRRFRAATHAVEQEQHHVLARLLRDNAATEFGRAHGFASLHTAAEYARAVPLRTYEEHRPWLTRAQAGHANVLTREPVRLFEPTGGSSALEGGATKLIPYTALLQAEFQRGVRAWIADLYTHEPALLGGPAYWSVSPVSAHVAQRTSGGIPVGFADDTAYVGGWTRRLVRAAMAVPADVKLAADLEAFRYRTLLHLVHARELRLISVWSPTFLSLLVERLAEWLPQLAHDLRHGRGIETDSRRAQELDAAARVTGAAELHARLWPRLRIVSCWQDGNAAAPATALHALLPQARMQGKGLLATEAFVSLPLTGCDGAALAVRSHFLEFLPEGETQTTALAHELEPGQRYSVVVTTGGGLYRYRLGDTVEVTGHLHGCPLIRFAGRDALVSDWVGEKLTEAHATRVLRSVAGALALQPRFAMLAFAQEPAPAYELYLDADATEPARMQCAGLVDEGLRENFHYDYARRLGQLGPVRAVCVADGASAYLEAATACGQRMGDVKVPALERRSGWAEVFRTRERS